MSIIRWGNENVGDPDVTPAPHRDIRGRLRPPVGTFGEMLDRAHHGDPPKPLSEDWLARLLVTLDSPDAAAALVATLRPPIEKLILDIMARRGREAA